MRSLVVVRHYGRVQRTASRRIIAPEKRENDPFLPLQLPPSLPVVDPNSFAPRQDKAPRAPIEARGDMTPAKFLTTIGRGAEEQADKFESWEEFSASSGETLKEKGVPVRTRRWILSWLEHYRQGEEPRLIPLNSRAKKNKFLSRRKPKTAEQKKRD